jgi:hypothetical protein
MPTLEYSTPAARQINQVHSVAVFLPGLIAFAAYYLATYPFWPKSDAGGVVLLTILSAAEILTIVLLFVWRGNLHIFSIVVGG